MKDKSHRGDLKKPSGILFDMGDTLLTYEGMDPLAGT